MKRKIFGYIFLSCFVTSIVVSILIWFAMFQNSTQTMEQDVTRLGFEYAEKLDSISGDKVELLNIIPHGDFRITLISADGEVLFDNRSDTTENHKSRPEIMMAYQSGYGDSTRYSDTIQLQTYYYATLLDDGNVIRVSQTIDSVVNSLLKSLPFVIVCVLIAMAGSLVISQKFSDFVIEPINTIDIENPLKTKAYKELTPLLLRIDSQTVQLKDQMKDIEKMRDELSDIMEHMEEGLVVLNSQGKVLSINNTATKILDVQKSDCIGHYVLEINRGEVFQNINNSINDKKNTQVEFEKGEKIYNISLSNINSGGSILLFVDITEKVASEKLRREFSANVSHELKTPLQTISGCAELLKNNLVQESDKPDFINKIYNESINMTSLIQDIIKLSHLDENAFDAQKQPVDILKVVNQVENDYKEIAKNKDITLKVSGQPAVLSGVELMLRECVANVVDNAIKYTNEGGAVDVGVLSDQDAVRIKISDNGVGIPKDQQSRVFERFYRVDKSRCKDSGGTGLGLSIVKHAVLIHNGLIDLESEEGKGTEITITLPK